MTGNAIKKHCLRAKGESVEANGRPFALNNEHINQLQRWILAAPHPPPIEMVKSYIEGEFHKHLISYSLKISFEKANLFVELATHMDENRYFADKRKIDFLYAILQSFCQAHTIPAHFVLNLDEEGHEEYSDSKKVKVFVPLKDKSKDPNYPVSRKNDYTTFLACITLEISYLNPLVVIKRQIMSVFTVKPYLIKLDLRQMKVALLTVTFSMNGSKCTWCLTSKQ